MSQLKCPRCDSSEFKKGGFYTFSDGTQIQRYRCLCCRKSFPAEYLNPPALAANIDCPQCGSSQTVKQGKNLKRRHGTVQKCRCKSCGKQFTLGGRKRLLLFLAGQLIHSCWYPPGIQYVPDLICPSCNERKAIYQSSFWDNRQQQKIRRMVCLGCGQKFTGEGRPWKNSTSRRLEKGVVRHPWCFEDDKWDLRELYPQVEEHEFNLLFLNFNNCGLDWFKKLVKGYVLWRIKTGVKFTTLKNFIIALSFFGRFLQKKNISSLEEVSRPLLATYLTEKRSQIGREHLNHEIGIIKSFFDWGNNEKLFTTSPTLITTFDRPKIFYDEPDPLENSVLEAIRDNLYVLPEPLQLMFMLGFWLGTRPGELCHLPKNCCCLDPDGSTWWLEFERKKTEDEHKLPITTDLVRLIQKQQEYINEQLGEDYSYLFCHYQEVGKMGYPKYPQIKPVKRPPLVISRQNPMVKAIRHLIEYCDIKDSNGKLAHFTGAILRPTRATYLIHNGYSLEFVRIWLKHRSAATTKRHYTRYRPGELLDVATVMANLDGKFYPYDSNPEVLRQNLDDLRQNPELHELDGLTMLNGEPLIGYCTFREFCPRFGHCYTCGFHVASADKLPDYKVQLEQLRAKKQVVFDYGSAEILEHYQRLVNALENIIEALESNHE